MKIDEIRLHDFAFSASHNNTLCDVSIFFFEFMNRKGEFHIIF
jgi:hypothetical protein